MKLLISFLLTAGVVSLVAKIVIYPHLATDVIPLHAHLLIAGYSVIMGGALMLAFTTMFNRT